MATLLLCLQGPLQSWGLDSRFGERMTATEPSKSGVLGLLCAALGRDRHEPVEDLAALRFAVRVDRPGTLLRDYHTALDVAKSGADGTDTVLSNRWYLTDAAFLAGLEGDALLLRRIDFALGDPVWPLFLGRKSCPPSAPPRWPAGVIELGVEAALRNAAPLPGTDTSEPVRLVLEDPAGSQSKPDQPIAPFAARRFGWRRVRTEFMTWNLPASA